MSRSCIKRIDTYPVRLASRTFGIKDFAVYLDVAYVEKFIVVQSVQTASFDVRFDVIELTELPCKFEMGFICETCTAKDNNTVLDRLTSERLGPQILQVPVRIAR